jgi:hypothetical protein
MRSIKQFDDATIEELFGADDAENEKEGRFKEYFYYNKVFANLDNELPIRLLVGHKGIGKSALLKRAFLSDRERGRFAVRLQPSDILGTKIGAQIKDFNQLVERWKDGLLAAVAVKAVEEFARDKVEDDEISGLGTKISRFLPMLSKMLADRARKLSDKVDQAIVATFVSARAINIYIDDIDRGWTASENDIRNISALLNAVRDISGSDQRIRFRIGLRSDVYFLVRTSDESTDKIERHVIWLNWTNHEILCVIAKRITTFFGEKLNQDVIAKMGQSEISDSILSRVIEPRFQGNGHWSNRPIHNVLLSLTRRRPRDLVKLMHGASRCAFMSGHNKIGSRDLERSFESYSGERLQDIVNEFKTELPNIERLVLGFKPVRKTKKASDNYLYTPDGLVLKVKNIAQNSTLQFRNGKPVTPRSLIQFLYKIEFITARKDSDAKIERKFFDQNRFLASEIAEFGYDWEVHPAYRWALQPHDVNRILNDIFPDS